MVDLRPCPFCGGEAHLIEGDEAARIQCANAKFHFLALDGDNNVAADLVECWNRRLCEAALRAELREAREIIRDALFEMDSYGGDEVATRARALLSRTADENEETTDG